MNLIKPILCILLGTGPVFGAPNEKLFQTMIEVANTALDEDEKSPEFPDNVSGLPPEMQKLFELSAEEEKKLNSGNHIYTKEQLDTLVKRVSEHGVALPVIAVELVNRSNQNKLNPYERTLLFRFLEYTIEKQKGKNRFEDVKPLTPVDEVAVLSKQIEWPLRALRIDPYRKTKSETVADKFSHFQQNLKENHESTFSVYLAPRVAKMNIPGWEAMEGTALPVAKASVEETIILFCDKFDLSFQNKSGIVLIDFKKENQ